MDEARAALTRRVALVAAAAVPTVFVALFFVVPFAAILRRGLFEEGVSLPVDVWLSRETLAIVWFTLWQAAVSTVMTLLAGLPLAWALGRFTFPGRSLVRAFALVPFVLPTVVVATAFLALLPDGLERGLPAILAAHVYFNVAIVALVVGGAWEALGREPGEAAAVLGAGPWHRLREVTLPLLTPALSAAAALTFLFCFTSFGVILILGGPRRTTLETEIFNQAARAFDLRTASALALLQLVAVAVALVLVSRLEARASHLGSAATRPGGVRAPVGSERGALIAVVLLTCAALALPVVSLVLRSLDTGTAAWRALVEETPALLVEPWHAVVNSLLFAALAACLSTCVGALAAAVLARTRPGALDALVLLPLGASAVMLGFGFLIAFDDPPLDFRSSWWLVPVAQSLVAAPFVVRIVAPAMRSVERRTREAAAVLGASPWRAWREIDLPLVGRALGVAAGFAFAIALGEFGATVFVARAEWPTLPVAIFRFLGRPGAENQALAAVLAVCLAALTVVVALALERVRPDRSRLL